MNQDATLEAKELFNQAKLFTHPKPSKLIYHLAKIATGNKSDDIILDFFSGSATTAHAVMQLNAEDGGNRRFIMVQLPELCPENSEAAKAGYPNICEIGKERIRRAGQKILEQSQASGGQESINNGGAKQLSLVEDADPDDADDFASASAPSPAPLDIGFKVFKLDSSNLKTWDVPPPDVFGPEAQVALENRLNSMIDRVKPDRTDLDMVYEIMLKIGVELTDKVEALTICGKTVWSVDDALLLICLETGIDLALAERMAALNPGRIILADQGIADDTVMANIRYYLLEREIDIKLV